MKFVVSEHNTNKHIHNLVTSHDKFCSATTATLDYNIIQNAQPQLESGITSVLTGEIAA